MAKDSNSFGAWAFIIGVVLAVLGGIIVKANFVSQAIVLSVLIILGLIVGFLNVTKDETKDYLLAAVSLVIVTSLGGQVLSVVQGIGPYLGEVLGAIMTFVVAATIVVTIKAIYALAQD